MKQLLPGYSAEIKAFNKKSWHHNLENFRDANIFQSWSYEAINSGPKNLSHLLLRKDGKLVAAAQVRIVKMPITSVGVAYVRWGPMWRPREEPLNVEVFGQAIRALRNEYACRHRLVVRIVPPIFDDQADIFGPILNQEGYTRSSNQESQRTFVVDLGRSLEELRKGLDQKWRNRLNRGERNNLNIIEGFDDDLFKLFLEVYGEMHDRKNFQETVDVKQFRLIQSDLPESLKMKIFIAFCDGKPAAGVICSGIGDMGVYLFGGTSDAGLSAQGSYVLQWRALNWLKEKGAACYDLYGIDAVANPGTYHFKSGMSGKNGKEVAYLGSYDASDNVIMRKALRFAEILRTTYAKKKKELKRSLTAQ